MTQKNQINFENKLLKIPIKKIYIKFVIIIILIAVIYYFLFNNYFFKPKQIKDSISGETAGEKIIEFLNTKTDQKIEYVSYNDLGNIYEVTIKYNGENVPVYITKDGNYFIQGAIPL